MANIEINVVIGSWGSYNECNERALGSRYLKFADYSDWDEIEEELEKQGFILDGIDEELFIQDIEGLPANGANWDYVNPQRLFETLKESNVLDEEYKFETMQAFLEVRSLSEFESLVESYGYHWDDSITIYKGFDWEDYGREIFENTNYKIPDDLLNYFDFEAYGESCGVNYAEKYSGGIIEIHD